MKHIFIINSYTLKDQTNIVKNKIEEYCKKENISYEIEINDKNYDTEDIANKYKNTKNIIIAVGGDGVINRVLNCIANTQNILGFIPFGTGNDFYKTVKQTIKEEQTKIDIVKINNKYFLNTACFGIDADVANNKNVVRLKIIPKKHKYNISLFYNFFKYKCRNFEVEYNNKKITADFTTIAVCNGRYYGGGFNISPSAILDDNLLNIYIAPKLNKLSIINLILKIKKGTHEDSPKITVTKTNKISLKSKVPVKCNIDGEELTAKEFNIELIPQGLTLYYNQNLIDYIKSN